MQKRAPKSRLIEKRKEKPAKKKKSLIARFFGLFKKKRNKKEQKKSDVRKIYKTIDGYFTDNSKIDKPRRVAVIDQRKDDGALAVVKIYSKKDKKGKAYVDKVVLRPKNHSSLTEDSIVGSKIHIGRKGKDGQYKAILAREMKPTNDELTKREHRKIKKYNGGKTKKNKKTAKRTLRLWKKHFKDKK